MFAQFQVSELCRSKDAIVRGCTVVLPLIRVIACGKLPFALSDRPSLFVVAKMAEELYDTAWSMATSFAAAPFLLASRFEIIEQLMQVRNRLASKQGSVTY